MMYRVKVTQEVLVTVDADSFDETFMEEFSESFFAFDTVEQHAEHLGQLYARGIVDNGDFIEGYGKAADMGIHFNEGPIDIEVEQEPTP